jgi:FkbM family methyltransferase
MNRRDFLVGAVSGLAVGTGTVKGFDYYQNNSPDRNAGNAFSGSHISYAQQGEDLIIKNIFDTFKIPNPSYIDIGAFDPIIGSNTYLFYLQGSKGLLVEPNPALCKRLKSVRRKDKILNIGIGTTDQKEADYYILRGDGQLNTFSKEQAEKQAKLNGPGTIKQVIKMPLVNINEVLQESFQSRPNLFSIDAEGLDLETLKTLDFNKFHPQIICVETSELGTGNVSNDIVAFLESKNYSVRGSTFVNSIFLDNALLEKMK